MTTSYAQASAKIYQFPKRGRFAVAGQRDELRPPRDYFVARGALPMAAAGITTRRSKTTPNVRATIDRRAGVRHAGRRNEKRALPKGGAL